MRQQLQDQVSRILVEHRQLVANIGLLLTVVLLFSAVAVIGDVGLADGAGTVEMGMGNASTTEDGAGKTGP